jgi:hypothetical protein
VLVAPNWDLPLLELGLLFNWKDEGEGGMGEPV